MHRPPANNLRVPQRITSRPENFNTAWRAVRDELGMPEVTSHSFRKTVATLIDDAGLSARIGADHLGHAKVSVTPEDLPCRLSSRRPSMWRRQQRI